MYSTTSSTHRTKHGFAPAPLALLIRQCLGAGFALAAAGVAAQTAGTTHAGAAAPSGTALKEVIVSDQAEAIGGLQKTYSGGQFARGGSLGILGNTDLMNVPFSTTNYTSELIQNQQALSVADVVMNDASVRTLTSRGGFGDDFQVRGFTVSNTDISMNGLFGLSPSTRVPLEMIERVEVLKGPGALANGVGPGGSIGGSINVVTKRAADAPLTRLTTTYMGKSQLGAHLDVGRRFGEDNQWGVRVNGLVRGGEGNIDGGKQNLNLGSVGLDYIGARTRWSMDALATRGETKEFRPQTSFAGSALAVPAVPDARLNFYPGTKLQDNVKTVMSRIEHDLSDSTTLYGSLGYTDLDYEQTFPSGRPDALGNFNVSNAYYDQYTQVQSGRRGRAYQVQNRWREPHPGCGCELPRSGDGLLLCHVDHHQPLQPVQPRAPASDDRGAWRARPQLGHRTIQRGGGRHHGFRQRQRAGHAGPAPSDDEADQLQRDLWRTDQPVRQGCRHAPGRPGLQANEERLGLYQLHGGPRARRYGRPDHRQRGRNFAPQKSKQNEVGVKVDWGRLTTQAAVYQIKRPGSITDPVTNVYSFGGEQRNRGLELTAYGEIQRGLRAMASASFNSAKLTRTAGGVNQGNNAAGVPDRTFNLGLDWDTPVQGLSINGRVINTSAVYADAANRLRVDAWTRLDLGARYATKVAGKPVVFRANLENVADKNYWVVSNYVTVGAPRTLMLSAAVDF